MTDKEMDTALEIVSLLISREPVSKDKNTSLYEDYQNNGEVYDMVQRVIRKLNMNLYEYNYGLYISAGENNRVFGYTNEELKKEIGVKLNRELYLCYFIIYTIITRFYKDSRNYTFTEYVKTEDVISGVDITLSQIVKDMKVLNLEEVEANSFKEIALTWEDIPVIGSGEAINRASRGSKSGFVKLVFNFMVAQELMIDNEGRYYPTDRLRALIENYYDNYKGRLYEIMKGEN